VEITVRHAEPADYEAMHRIMSGPKVAAGTLQLPLQPAEAWRKRLANPPEGLFLLVACVEGEVVGNLGRETFPNRPRVRHVGTVGLSVRDDWQGRGVGTALLGSALNLADDWLNLSRVELTVYTDNAAEMSFLVYEDSPPGVSKLPQRAPLTSGVPSSLMTTFSFSILYSLLRCSGERASRASTVSPAYDCSIRVPISLQAL
jgi:putative acetyltransferase